MPEAIDHQQEARARAFTSPPVLLHPVSESGLPAQPLDPAESISLLQAMSVVPDPRRAGGCRHSLQSILLLAVGAVPAGARSYAAIASGP